MIDWLLNILYNVGMFIGAIIALIGVAIYLSGNAERSNPNVANQRMLHELRKLNHLQREQIELEKAAQIQAKAEKLAPLQQANVHYLEQKLEEQAKEQTRLYALERQWSYIQLEAQVAELKRLMEEENMPASTIYTVMENEFNAEFWENYAAIKAEYTALNDVNMVAQMNAEQANYNAFKHSLEAVLFPELTVTQAPIASHLTPPPLPSMD